LPINKSREYGTWLWTPTLQMTPDYIQNILQGAKENNLNTIYLSVDSYLDIYMMEEGQEKDKQYKNFVSILNSFIEEANSFGIAVDALSGWSNWAEEGHTYKPIAILNFVKDFNQTQKSKFRGFQYDIEPYLLPEFQKNESLVLQNFLNLIQKSLNMLEDSDLKFSVVIPDFYDEKDGLTSRFMFNGEVDYVFKHLVRILDQKSGSAIILMSYRNKAIGDDGTIEISMNEVETLDQGFHKTKLIIAQETGDVPPPYITFHNTSKEDLKREVTLIENLMKNYPNFGGIAYHYANSFLSLK
jgi:hypothetical protein